MPFTEPWTGAAVAWFGLALFLLGVLCGMGILRRW